MAEYRHLSARGAGQRLRALLACAAFSFACAGAVGAQVPDAPHDAATQPAPQKTAWAALTPAQQDVLAPLHAQWDALGPRQQQHFLHVAARWQDAPAPRRAAIAARIASWAEMTPDQRAALRERVGKFRALAPEQQQDLRDAFQRYRELAPAEREALRQRFERLSPGERDAAVSETRPHRGWQRVLADVPDAERAPVRAMWLSFTRDERHALRRHAHAMTPAQHDELRARLLAMTPAGRSAFIATLAPAPPPQ